MDNAVSEDYFVKMVAGFEAGEAAGPFWFMYEKNLQILQYFEDKVVLNTWY